MRLDSTQKKTLAILLIALGLVGGLVWYPAYRDIRRLSAEIAQIDAEVDRVRGKSAMMASLDSEVRRMRHELGSAKQVIPLHGEVSGLLREIGGRVESLRLADPTLSTQPVVEGPGYLTLPLSVNFSGSSRSIFEFIKQVESMPQLVQVSGVRLSIEKEPSTAVHAVVDLNAFYYPAKEGTR